MIPALRELAVGDRTDTSGLGGSVFHAAGARPSNRPGRFGEGRHVLSSGVPYAREGWWMPGASWWVHLCRSRILMVLLGAGSGAGPSLPLRLALVGDGRALGSSQAEGMAPRSKRRESLCPLRPQAGGGGASIAVKDRLFENTYWLALPKRSTG